MNRFQDTLSWWNETADVRLESGFERASVRLREQRRLFGRFFTSHRELRQATVPNQRTESAEAVCLRGNPPPQ